MNTFRVIFFAMICLVGHSESNADERQLDCNFTSSVKLTIMNPTSPKFETQTIAESFLVFVDEKSRDASYINLRYKVKSPLNIVHSSGAMITLVEKVPVADNHFSLSIFWNAGRNGEFPAVKNNHSWNPTIAFYAPEMILGTCRQ